MNAGLIKEVEAALAKHIGKTVCATACESIGGGCINNALKMKTNHGVFFVKWNARGKRDMFIREMEGLRELEKATKGELLIPGAFCASEINETPGFLVLEYLNPKHSHAEDDVKLGRGLAAMHMFTAKKFGFYADNYCGATPQNNSWKNSWPEFYGENRLNYLLNLLQQKGQLNSSEIQVYEKLIEKIPQLLPRESESVIIHGDLWSGNYMLTEKGPALIDPAAYYADREMEFAIMTMFGGFSSRFYDAYNEYNPLFPDWRQRNKLYQLYHVLNHYYLFGGGYRQQALSMAKEYI